MATAYALRTTPFIKNARIVAKLPVDVKPKIRLQSCAGASAPGPPTTGDPVISPDETATNPILTLSQPVDPSLFLILFVNKAGDIEPDADRYIGELTECLVTVLSEGAVWVPQAGKYAHRVLQRYNLRGHTVMSHSIRCDTVPDDTERADYVQALCDRAIVVTAIGHKGILGLGRAMKEHAPKRVLSGLQALHLLMTLPDETLSHALETNLKGTVPIKKHRKYIRELKSHVHSNGEIAGEIRDFLEEIGDAEDRTARHNVYRMVMIVRAIIRRAKLLIQGKEDTLTALTAISIDISRYISAVTEIAARIRTELKDQKPWWTGENGTLTPKVAANRRKNFVERLREYEMVMRAITAQPFYVWANDAADRLHDLADWIEAKVYGNVGHTTVYIVQLMEAILHREKVSRCITHAKRGDSGEISVLETVIILQSASHPVVRKLQRERRYGEAQQLSWAVEQLWSGSAWSDVESAARRMEELFDTL